MPYITYILAFGILFLTGCTTMLPKDHGFIPSYHVSSQKISSLSKLYSDIKPVNIKSKTGVILLNDNKLAFLARVAAIDLADLSLDLQYYHWQADEVGMILMERLLRAADRGVRVRLLIDDSNSWDSTRKQTALALINHHPNIQVKIYNPLGGTYSGSGMRTLAILGNFNRVNHRMHNKLFIADNQLAIFGGRNIGNIYFGVGKKKNFRDMDVLAVGHQVDDISTAFDDYWNSEWTYRIELLDQSEFTTQDLEEGALRLKQQINEASDFPYKIPSREDLLKRLKQLSIKLDWAELEVFADPPRKDLQEKSRHVNSQMQDADFAAKDEALISSPYFIPSEELISRLGEQVKRGVNVKILTNSLASNDVTLAQYGYASRRRDILKSGVEIYELRTDAIDRENYMAVQNLDSDLGLHAKVSVIDSSRVLIGSFNIDPRSNNINTEVVVMVNSEALAKKVRQALLRDMHPRNSYQVFLEEKNNQGQIEFGSMRWRGEEEGELVVHRNEPNTNFMKKFGELLFGILPIDDQL